MEDFQKALIEESKRLIPSLEEILDKAWKRLDPHSQEILKSFSEILLNLEERANEIYLEYEKKALKALAENWVKKQKGTIRERIKRILQEDKWEGFIKKARDLFAEFGLLVQALEKDLGNMRKARGGKTFERIIERMLLSINIPVERPKGQASRTLRRIDLVIPSVEVALNTPDRAVFLTCKRTLRERWKQEVPQVGPNRRVYLLTIDEDISESKAQEINEKGLIAFVRDEIKQNSKLEQFTWIRKLSTLPWELKEYGTR